MKFLLLFNILLIIGAVLARPKSELEEDSSEEETTIASIKNDDNSNKGIEKADDKTNINLNDNKKKPASFFFGQQSHSVFNGNGNSIVVSSRFDSNGREEKYVSVGSPKIRIDGEYCEYMMYFLLFKIEIYTGFKIFKFTTVIYILKL